MSDLRSREVVVAVAGGFDPLHRGHVEHIRLASRLGTRLVIITHPDLILVDKKGYCFMPLEDRLAVLAALRDVEEVMVSVDQDGTVAETLELLRPHIFAKGGDRGPSNMPASELEVCKRLGIRIQYGVGPQLNSSSELVRRVRA